MSEHLVTIVWERSSKGFDYEEFNREHLWRFDNGTEVPASAAIAFHGRPDHVDPEEAFVASVSSCHMLTFLALCSRKRIVVNNYEDHAVGHLSKNSDGKFAITHIELQPVVEFAEGNMPDAEALDALHHRAHEECFISNSILTPVTIA